MTYGQIKREALRLICSDTIAGEQIAPSYNNQADYILAIPGLVDACQLLIATTQRKIPVMTPIEALEKSEDGDFNVYQLPKDCWRIVDRGLVWQKKDTAGQPAIARYKGYRLLAGDRLYVPKGMEALSLEYWRYPESVGTAPEDGLEMDNSRDVHAAIPYYVAAHLVIYDDAFRYSALYNEFEARLNRLKDPVSVEEENTDDVYAGFGA